MIEGGKYKMKKIYVVKSITNNREISDEAVGVWAVLQPYAQGKDCIQIVTAKFLGWLLYGRDVTRKEKDGISKGFKELIKLGYITIVEKLDNEYICDLSKLYFQQKSEYFTMISYEEIRKIMNLGNKLCRYKILRYFLCIVGAFNNSNDIEAEYRGKVTALTMSYIDRELMDIPKPTALKYNNLLEKGRLLYIYRFNDITVKNDKVSKIPNVYSRYEDSKICIKYSVQHQNHFGIKSSNIRRKVDKEKADEKRSLAQKYRALCKGKEYDINTIKKIYEYCVEYNENSFKEYNNNLSKDFTPELNQKNMDVFDKYLEEINEIISEKQLKSSEVSERVKKAFKVQR